MDNGYSLADIKAATGNEAADGFGGGWMWIIVLFLFLFGAGGFGGNNAGGGCLNTTEFQASQNYQTLDRKLNDIGDGLCSLGYSLNNTILTEGRTLQSQVADCCCSTQLSVANLSAQNDRNTCAITTAIHAEGEATRAVIAANEIQALRDKVSSLEMDTRMCGIVRYPLATTYNSGANPFCTGCGC